MRPLIVVGLLGTALSMGPLEGQSSPEQPASGTAESNKKHSSPSATNALTESAPERRGALAEARRDADLRKQHAETPGDAVPATPAPAVPTVQAVPPGPPQKNLTGEEFALIRVGSTEKEVLAILGPPSSQVIVPDDDGHLRESLQYWVKASPMGTVRLDNGRVVQIETKPK
jgi:hypothetical protein